MIVMVVVVTVSTLAALLAMRWRRRVKAMHRAFVPVRKISTAAARRLSAMAALTMRVRAGAVALGTALISGPIRKTATGCLSRASFRSVSSNNAKFSSAKSSSARLNSAVLRRVCAAVAMKAYVPNCASAAMKVTLVVV